MVSPAQGHASSIQSVKKDTLIYQGTGIERYNYLGNGEAIYGFPVVFYGGNRG